MNEMNFYTLNGEQYEVADKKVRENLLEKADISYVNQALAPAIPVTMTGETISTDIVSSVEHEIKCRIFENSELNGYAYENTVHEREGMTFSYDTNGIVTINGYLSLNIYENIIQKSVPLAPGDYYLCGFNVPEGKRMNLEYRTRNGITGYVPSTEPGTVITIEKPDFIDALTLRGLWRSEFSNETFYIKLIKGIKELVPELSGIRVSRTDGNIFVFGKSTALFNSNGVAQSSYGRKAAYNFIVDVGTYGYTAWIDGIPKFCSSDDVTLEFDIYIPSSSGNKNTAITGGLLCSDGEKVQFNDDPKRLDKWVHYSHTFAAEDIVGKTITHIECQPFGDSANYTKLKARVKNIKLSVEGMDLPYNAGEVLDTFTADSDGMVSGMTSVSPYMTILTDHPNVTVEAIYNADTKKYIDKKSEQLQSAILSTGGNV